MAHLWYMCGRPLWIHHNLPSNNFVQYYTSCASYRWLLILRSCLFLRFCFSLSSKQVGEKQEDVMTCLLNDDSTHNYLYVSFFVYFSLSLSLSVCLCFSLSSSLSFTILSTTQWLLSLPFSFFLSLFFSLSRTPSRPEATRLAVAGQMEPSQVFL